jgi:ATP:corrinoid adenosyltransferase
MSEIQDKVQRASGECRAPPIKRKGLVIVNTGDGKGKTLRHWDSPFKQGVRGQKGVEF